MEKYKYKAVPSTRFSKDVRKLEKSGKYDLSKLKAVIKILAAGEQLPAQYVDHPMKGKFKGYRDCHIQPDWVLIYKLEKNELKLLLTRTGSHSDLEI